MAYKWNFETVGGNTRVKISTGEDIQHLGELDQKMWTVLSCPTQGLEIPQTTLSLMDSDGDGHIRVNEVVKASQWLCSVLKNADLLLDETDEIALNDLNEENAEAQQMLAVAKQIAGENDKVTLADVLAAEAAKAATVPEFETKALPEAPVDGGVIAAYHAQKEAYDKYFEDLRLEKMGLAVADAENAPKISAKAWTELTAKISAYEAEVAQINADNAAAEAAAKAAIEAATAEFQSLIKLLRLKKAFYPLLKNYVTFSDFYSKKAKAVFQCGTLVIDQRECSLCVRVADAGAMGAQAGLSGMYLLFCDCENKPTGKKMSIIAAMTAGDIRNLSVGKNAIFYDCDGLDYEAKVTKIIDNPISIRQAFWTPYKKFADWVSGLINKSVAEKEAKGFEDMKANATTATEQAASGEKKEAAPFDIAKFAGIFAAFGMALGAIGTALVAVANGLGSLEWWQLILVVVGILLVISGPSMLMAYFKLRKRNLAPVLNANGWAVNAEAIVNVPFGNTLTAMAKFPIVKTINDPYSTDMPTWKKWCLSLAALAIVIAIVGIILQIKGIYLIYY